MDPMILFLQEWIKDLPVTQAWLFSQTCLEEFGGSSGSLQLLKVHAKRTGK